MPTAACFTTASVDPLTLIPGDFVLLSGWCYVTGEITKNGNDNWSIPLVTETGDEGLITIHQEAEKLIEGHPISWQPKQLHRRVERMRRQADVLARLAGELETGQA